ncbi:MAG: MarR family transcriptional regulator [Flavobacteriales bacterium]|nr:MarR family transcriptional regulator [Flavobacteriales bacterium]
MKVELLHSLIDLVEEFNKSNTSGTMEDFVVWLSGKYFKSEEAEGHQEQLDLMLAFQISMLNKSIKRQTKEVISKSSLSSLDGYSFLLHLDQADSFRKMELIEMHNLEAPTGIEVIKRLLAKGLIEEFNDSEDKRAKRVKMTDAGKAELERLRPMVDAKFKSFAQALPLNDKLSLVAGMNKLIRS